MPQQSKPIILADVIRFLAACSVMAFHLALQSWYSEASNIREISGGYYRFEWSIPAVWFGWVGVQIFFVLSGFVIAFSLQGNAKDFFRRRFLRLYPTAWICVPISVAVVVALTSRENSEILVQAVKSLVMWPKGDWISGVYWTLPVELAFYSFVGLVAWRKGNQFVPYAVLALIPWSGLYWFVRALGQTGSFPEWAANLLLLTYGSCFALGVLIWHVAKGNRQPIFLLAILAATLVSVVSILPKAMANGALYSQPFIAPVVLWLCSVACLMLAIRYNDRLLGVLGSGWTRQLGIMTYPLYLLHPAVGAGSLWFMSKLGAPSLLALLVAVINSFLIAFVVSRLFEPRLRKFIDRKFFKSAR